MAGNLPVPTKTWLTATVANTLLGNDVQNQRDMMLKMHAQRKAFGHIVRGSGNAVTGGMDGVDRWSIPADLAFGSSGVWMVYENAVGVQDMVAYGNFGESDWLFAWSADGGFTGGSSTTRPTAPHQVNLYSNSWFGRGDGGSNPQFVCNMWCSSDRTCFRQSFWFGGLCFGNLFYDAVDDPSSGWTTPNYAVVNSYGAGISSGNFRATGFYGDFVQQDHGTGQGTFLSLGPHGAMHMFGTIDVSGVSSPPIAGLATTAKNKISGTYRLGTSRCGLYEPIANADGGWHGRVFDLWWVQIGATLGARVFPAGSTIPLDGSKQFVILGDFMLPWNGTAFRIT